MKTSQGIGTVISMRGAFLVLLTLGTLVNVNAQGYNDLNRRDKQQNPSISLEKNENVIPSGAGNGAGRRIRNWFRLRTMQSTPTRQRWNRESFLEAVRTDQSENIIQFFEEKRHGRSWMKWVDDDGRNALMLAAMNGHSAILQQLIDHLPLLKPTRSRKKIQSQSISKKVGIDSQDTVGGETALLLATSHGHTEAVKILVTAGANLDALQSKTPYLSALQIAVKNEDRGLVQLLLELGATPSVTALQMAAKQGLLDAVAMLIQYFTDNQSARVAVSAAIGAGQKAVLLKLLDHYQDNSLIQYALMEAAARGKRELVEPLVKRMKNLGIQDSDHNGNTALMSAAGNGHIETVKFLVEQAGQNPLASNNIGKTSVMIAAESGHVEPVHYLLTMTAVPVSVQLSQVEIHGRTAFMLAARNVQLSAVKYLLETFGREFVQLDRRDNNGWTALELADAAEWDNDAFIPWNSGRTELVELLRGIGASGRLRHDRASPIMQNDRSDVGLILGALAGAIFLN